MILYIPILCRYTKIIYIYYDALYNEVNGHRDGDHDHIFSVQYGFL